MTCGTCGGPIQIGQSVQFGHHVRASDCIEATRQATALACLRIAQEVGDMRQFGAYRIFNEIRQRFELSENWAGRIG